MIVKQNILLQNDWLGYILNLTTGNVTDNDADTVTEKVSNNRKSNYGKGEVRQ